MYRLCVVSARVERLNHVSLATVAWPVYPGNCRPVLSEVVSLPTTVCQCGYLKYGDSQWFPKELAPGCVSVKPTLMFAAVSQA